MAIKMGHGAAFGGSALPTIAGREDSVVNSEINMTPMIDVMLVLLIIFMVITPALVGYTVTLPKAVTAAPEKEDRVTLAIDNQGRFFVDEAATPVPQAALTETLRAAYAARPDDHVLYLKADQAAQYSLVLTAIDAARDAGVRRIGAITEMKKQDAPGGGS